jgi:hypothetical protein
MSFGEEKDLTFKPFHTINFPDRYKNNKEPEKKTMKQRKNTSIYYRRDLQECNPSSV